jgi:subtilisin family serine protease
MGVAGIAPDVTLISVRVLRHSNGNFNDHIAEGIEWAWNSAHADVLSNSWGGGSQSNLIDSAIVRAATLGRNGLGAAVVFAAGNFSNRDSGVVAQVIYPASLGAVIAVGAIDRDGNLANYSPDGLNWGMVAPSSRYTASCESLGPHHGDLTTLDFWGWKGCNDGPNNDINYTSSFGGTSAAAPQVAAAAALLFAMHPTMSWGVAKPRIIYQSDPWGPATTYGAGKLNIYRILVPPLYNVIVATPPYYASNPSGGDMPYTYLWEAMAAGPGCGGDAVAPQGGSGGIVPNRPACGWQEISTSQQVYWDIQARTLRSTVTDAHNQQAQVTYYVP